MTYTNREIYESALRLLGETSEEYSEDYEERAPYIIASFCSQALEIDRRIRLIEELDEAEDFNRLCLELDANFPLSERLLGCASLYLAAMLLSDYDYELSESFYDKYCDAIAALGAAVGVSTSEEGAAEAISAVCESIVEKYFFD